MKKDPKNAFEDYVKEYGAYKKSTKESVEEYVHRENQRQRREGVLDENVTGVIKLESVPKPALKLWHKVMLATGAVIVAAAIVFCFLLAD